MEILFVTILFAAEISCLIYLCAGACNHWDVSSEDTARNAFLCGGNLAFDRSVRGSVKLQKCF